MHVIGWGLVAAGPSRLHHFRGGVRGQPEEYVISGGPACSDGDEEPAQDSHSGTSSFLSLPIPHLSLIISLILLLMSALHSDNRRPAPARTSSLRP